MKLMALEALKGVKEIGGFKVNQFYEDETIKAVLWNEHIEIEHEYNSIKFTFQDGPIKENGVNGCQIVTLIHAAKMLLEKQNEKFPCKENKGMIECLRMAIYWNEL